MKRHLTLAAILIVAFASFCFAQPQATASPSPAAKPKPRMSKAQIQAKLAASEKKLWEAWKNKDVKPFNATLTSDFVMIEDGGVGSKSDVTKEISSSPCDIKSVTLSDWKLTMINPSTAFLTYKGVADGTCAGTAIPPVWASSIWVNRGGRWMALSHQETTAK